MKKIKLDFYYSYQVMNINVDGNASSNNPYGDIILFGIQLSKLRFFSIIISSSDKGYEEHCEQNSTPFYPTRCRIFIQAW